MTRHTAGTILGYIGLASAGLMIGLGVALMVIRICRDLAWRIERRRRNGRGGDLLEALARKIEGRSL